MIKPDRDGMFRWLVVFDGETRLVHAYTPDGARRTGEYAQRVTGSPKSKRKALAVYQVDPRTNQPIRGDQ